MPAKRRPEVLAVVGAQFGSEGKGVVVHALAPGFDVHVRVGGPNAGHSFYHQSVLYKLQSIPCGWTNPRAKLVIGRGAIVDPNILMSEIEKIKKFGREDIRHRLFIDSNALWLTKAHHKAEGGVEGEIHRRIGSTGEGVGATRAARLARDGDIGSPTVSDFIRESDPLGLKKCLCDTVTLLNEEIQKRGRSCLLEGTQGSGLSLIHGPWPYVTSSDTNAAQFAVDCGIAPRLINRTMLVARSFPIRVAGNSGPLEKEISWGELSNEIGRPVEEKTTVTKKIRRIGRWDEALFKRAILLNSPTSLALTFVDYLCPEDEGKIDYADLSYRTRAFILYMESLANAKVAMIGTGGKEWNVIDRGLRP